MTREGGGDDPVAATFDAATGDRSVGAAVSSCDPASDDVPRSSRFAFLRGRRQELFLRIRREHGIALDPRSHPEPETTTKQEKRSERIGLKFEFQLN